MDWVQTFTVAVTTLGSLWWMHREHRADMKQMGEKMHQESRDFHGRLCALEEKYIQMMQRILEKK